MSLLTKCILYPVAGAFVATLIISVIFIGAPAADLGMILAALGSAAICGWAGYPLLLCARTPVAAGIAGAVTVLGIYVVFPILLVFLITTFSPVESGGFIPTLGTQYVIWFVFPLMVSVWFTMPVGAWLAVKLWREHLAP